MEPKIWDLPLPQVTIDEVFRAEGADYSRRPPRENQVQVHSRILEEAMTLVEVKAITIEVEITNVVENKVHLAGGHQLTSQLLAKLSQSAQKLALFAMTNGPAIDERVDTYQRAGKVVEAFAMDSTGSVIIAKAGIELAQRLEDKYHQEGLKTSFTLGPGHSYWPGLTDQQVLFDLLQPQMIGLRLNESNLILPRKSVSMAMVIGDQLPDFTGKSHCDFCTLHTNCNMCKTLKG